MSQELPELLSLERIEDNLFRSIAVSDEPGGLYGGQVAAQALRAAAATVADDRHPHSLHGYFLSRGDSSRRVLLTVHRDRDGKSYSNRRVIAVQNGVVIFNMVASFHVYEDGHDFQARQLPETDGPDGLPGNDMLSLAPRRGHPGAAPARARPAAAVAGLAPVPVPAA